MKGFFFNFESSRAFTRRENLKKFSDHQEENFLCRYREEELCLIMSPVSASR
jgi:hypothetical protein